MKKGMFDRMAMAGMNMTAKTAKWSMKAGKMAKWSKK